jgi:hypothetical protein
MQDKELQKLPAEKQRLVALALARPALLLDNGKPRDAKRNWASLLERHSDGLIRASAATGVLLDSEGKSAGTGFIVAPKMVLTTDFVLDRIGFQYSTDSKTWSTPAKAPRFCLGPDAANCGQGDYQVGKILYDGMKDKTRLMLVEVSGHDPVLVPPAPILDTLPAANEIIGRYAYVVGYSYRSPGMPADFLDELLGKDQGRKRVMPGRILAFGETGLHMPWDASLKVFTTDISTTVGTAGGPLIDLQTGKVYGASLGGIWRGDRGKFAWAAPIPVNAMEIIQRRLRGEPEPTVGGPGGTAPPPKPIE